jgi:hypothetical protein
MNVVPAIVLGGLPLGTMLLGWVYFGRWQVARPPIGTFNLGDVLVTLGCVVAVPLLYLAAPGWFVTLLLALGALSAVYVALEPLLSRRWFCWLVLATLVAAETLALRVSGPASPAYFLVNNIVVICGVVGVSNLWAQSGLKARDAAILGAALTIYDVTATAYLPLMSELFEHLVGLPFAPVAGTAGADGTWVGIGLGDLVMSTVFPLVMRKGYGHRAGWMALASGGLLIGGILVGGTLSGIGIFPVMAVLGPAIVAEYLWWARRRGPERTMCQYAAVAPARSKQPEPAQ